MRSHGASTRPSTHPASNKMMRIGRNGTRRPAPGTFCSAVMRGQPYHTARATPPPLEAERSVNRGGSVLDSSLVQGESRMSHAPGSVLGRITGPQHLKALSVDDRVTLAREIRERICEVVSKNGGH